MLSFKLKSGLSRTSFLLSSVSYTLPSISFFNSAIFAATATVAQVEGKDYRLPQNPTILHGRVDHAIHNGEMLVKSHEQVARVRYNLDNSQVLIGKDAKVNIDQAKSATFIMETLDNRQAQVLGKIESQGSLIMAFPGGVAFQNGSVVDVANLTVVAGKIDDSAFQNGKIKITPESHAPGALITNAGKITVQQGGLAALVAPTVAHYGVIVAKEGKVHLGKGDVSVDLYGDDLIKFKVESPQTLKTAKHVAKELGAAEGVLVLSTKEALNVVQGVVNTTVEQGQFATIESGEITIGGGDDSITYVGAKSQIQGDFVAVKGQQIEVSGKIKAGEILIGGDWHGGDFDSKYEKKLKELGTSEKIIEKIRPSEKIKPSENADFVTIHKEAILDVSKEEDAGKVVVWSDSKTSLLGTVLLDSKTGQAGVFEGSGKEILDQQKSFNISNKGKTEGFILFDPENLVFGSTTDITNPPWSSGGISLMSTIVTQGATYTATNWIIVADPISVTGALTLRAGQGIQVRSSIVTQGTLTLQSSAGGVTFQNLSATTGDISIMAYGDVVFGYNASSNISVPSGRLNINTTTGNINTQINTSSSIAASAINLTSSTGSIDISGDNMTFDQVIANDIVIVSTGDINSLNASSALVADGKVSLSAAGRIGSLVLPLSLSHGAGSYLVASSYSAMYLASPSDLNLGGAALYSSGPTKITAGQIMSIQNSKSITLNDGITLTGSSKVYLGAQNSIVINNKPIASNILIIQKLETSSPPGTLTIGANGFMTGADVNFVSQTANLEIRHAGPLTLSNDLQIIKDFTLRAWNINLNNPLTVLGDLIVQSYEGGDITLNRDTSAKNIVIDSDGSIQGSGSTTASGKISLVSYNDIGSDSHPLKVSHANSGYIVAHSETGKIYLSSALDLILGGDPFFYYDNHNVVLPPTGSTGYVNVYTKDQKISITSLGTIKLGTVKDTVSGTSLNAGTGALYLQATQIITPPGTYFNASALSISMDSDIKIYQNAPSSGSGIILTSLLNAWKNKPSLTGPTPIINFQSISGTIYTTSVVQELPYVRFDSTANSSTIYETNYQELSLEYNGTNLLLSNSIFNPTNITAVSVLVRILSSSATNINGGLIGNLQALSPNSLSISSAYGLQLDANLSIVGALSLSTSTGNITLNNRINATQVTLRSAGSISGGTITSNSLTMNSVSGISGITTNVINAINMTASSGSISATSSGGIVLGTVSASGNISLSAASISGSSITSGGVLSLITSSGDIGSTSSLLNTSGTSISIQSNKGVFLQSSSDMAGSVSAGANVILNTYGKITLSALQSTGSIALSAASDMNITTVGDTTFSAISSKSGNITFSAGGKVLSTGGEIIGNNITFTTKGDIGSINNLLQIQANNLMLSVTGNAYISLPNSPTISGLTVSQDTVIKHTGTSPLTLTSNLKSNSSFGLTTPASLNLQGMSILAIEGNLVLNTLGDLLNGTIGGNTVSVTATGKIGDLGNSQSNPVVLGQSLILTGTLGSIVLSAGNGGINISSDASINAAGITSSGPIKIQTAQNLNLTLPNTPSIRSSGDLQIIAGKIVQGTSSLSSSSKKITLKSLSDMTIDGFVTGSNLESLIDNNGTTLVLDAGLNNMIFNNKAIYRTGSLELYANEIIFSPSIQGLYAIDATGQNVIMGPMTNIDNNGKEVLSSSLGIYDSNGDTIISQDNSQGILTPEELQSLTAATNLLTLGNYAHNLVIKNDISFLLRNITLLGSNITIQGKIIANSAQRVYIDAKGTIILDTSSPEAIHLGGAQSYLEMHAQHIIANNYVTAYTLKLSSDNNLSIGEGPSDFITALSLKNLLSGNTVGLLNLYTLGNISLNQAVDLSNTPTNVILNSSSVTGNGYLLSLGISSILTLTGIESVYMGDIILKTNISKLAIIGISYKNVSIENIKGIEILLNTSPNATGVVSGDFSLTIDQGVLINYGKNSVTNGITTIYDNNSNALLNVLGNIKIVQNGITTTTTTSETINSTQTQHHASDKEIKSHINSTTKTINNSKENVIEIETEEEETSETEE